VLNRNVEQFLAETMQVAFSPSHLVPGIDLTADRLLRSRSSTYVEAQAARRSPVQSNPVPVCFDAVVQPRSHAAMNAIEAKSAESAIVGMARAAA